jgi:hypothetical protein
MRNSVFVVSIIAVLIIMIVLSYSILNNNAKDNSFNTKITYVPTVNNGPTITYYRLHDFIRYDKQSMDAMKSFQDAYKDANITFQKGSSYESANLIMFENLNRVDEAMEVMYVPKNTKAIYGLGGTDYMASKSMLALFMRSQLPKNVYDTVMPKTYVVSEEHDMQEFTYNSKENNVYIMKKNIQRQQGNYVTNDVNYILSHANEYVIIQEMLQNPLLINACSYTRRSKTTILCI